MDSAKQYVETRAIKEAVRGQEARVLDALGIPWEDGGNWSTSSTTNWSWRSPKSA